MKNAKGQNKNPYLKQIIISTCCAVLSLGVLAVATAAWFANNRKVTSSNMTVRMDPQASLVIKDAKEGDDKWRLDVNYSQTSTALIPATHGGNEKYKLQYSTTPSEIDTATGYAKAGSATLADVTDSVITEKRLFFKTYNVMIASAGKAFNNQTLTASMQLSFPADATAATNDPRYAAAVGVWRSNGGTPTEYLGTLHSKEVFDKQSSVGTPTVTNSIPITLKNDTIPETSSPIELLLICYFDGALQIPNSTPANAYVRTSSLETRDISITVSFTCEDKT